MTSALHVKAVALHRSSLSHADDFEGWRAAARSLLADHVPPDRILWEVQGEGGDLFGTTAANPVASANHKITVPRRFLALAGEAILARDPERFALLYTLLFRMQRHPALLDDRADHLILRLENLAKAVRRDMHKMRAFLRFREIQSGDGSRFVAWFEPEHHIVRANAAFFVNRFSSMHWSILTPALSLHWDGGSLTEAPGATKSDAPDGDPIEAVWKSYYASIFNPARIKVGAMLKEMPRKYWKNMPETALIPQLLETAQARESGMITRAKTDARGDKAQAWQALRDEAATCTRCPLCKYAAQTVFGEGPVSAQMMFVGEQPGDQEDRAGRPFVGPTGQLFDRAIADAGLDRTRSYVTNAVKHFKFEQRGKKRLHATPNAGEIEACRWWVDQERRLIQPKLAIALGATAALSLFGKNMPIGKTRGKLFELPNGDAAFITVHPSYLLRLPDKAAAAAEYARFVDDLRFAKKLAE